MKIDTLQNLLREAAWFTKLGHFEAGEKTIALRNLDPWSVSGATESIDIARIADEMEWLPCARDQPDPIHGETLERLIKTANRESATKSQSLEIYKLTLVSIRSACENPLLKVGPRDFTEAAKGAALFAVRRAVLEIAAEVPGFWCKLIPIYYGGNWPCGTMADGSIVVL